MALPLKSRGRSSSWKIEFVSGEKRSSVVFKRQNLPRRRNNRRANKRTFTPVPALKQLENTKLKVPKAFGLMKPVLPSAYPAFLKRDFAARSFIIS